MKKLPFIILVIVTSLLLGGLGYLGLQYQDLDSRYRALESASFQLEENNTQLNTKLADSTAQLEKKERYLTGQKEYISELSEKIDDITNDTEKLYDEDADESSKEDSETDGDSLDSFELDPFPGLYAEGCNPQDKKEEKIAYLTFDDGPSSLTPKVLDLLDQYNAKATFFVVCKNNEEYAKYLPEIVKRGHTLALHSYSHNYRQIYASKDAFLEDYEKVYDWVVENTGYVPSLFRFPGGSNNGSSYVVKEIIEELKQRGFQYFDWNVSSGDGSNLTTTDNIIDNICSNIGNAETPIVLMHDGSGKNATLAALPSVLRRLSDSGYEFRSLDKTVEPAQFR